MKFSNIFAQRNRSFWSQNFNLPFFFLCKIWTSGKAFPATFENFTTVQLFDSLQLRQITQQNDILSFFKLSKMKPTQSVVGESAIHDLENRCVWAPSPGKKLITSGISAANVGDGIATLLLFLLLLRSKSACWHVRGEVYFFFCLSWSLELTIFATFKMFMAFTI